MRARVLALTSRFRITLLLFVGIAVFCSGLVLPVIATTEVGPLQVTVTSSPNPYAIQGVTSVPMSVGVYGKATGSGGIGLEGTETQTNSIGVYGYSAGGFGVEGVSAGGTTPAIVAAGAGYGALGMETAAYTSNGSVTNASGVVGEAEGANAAGVFGYTTTTSGGAIAVDAYAGDESSTSLFLYSGGGLLVEAQSSYLNSLNPQKDAMQLDQSGDLTLAGNLTMDGDMTVAGTISSRTPLTTEVFDTAGHDRLAYAPEAVLSTIEDFGSGHMVSGKAFIPLAADFASVLDSDSSYMVFITPEGPNDGIYVASKTAKGFVVAETLGRSSMNFDYRIVGRPRLHGAQGRLALVSSAAMPRSLHPVRHLGRNEAPLGLSTPSFSSVRR